MAGYGSRVAATSSRAGRAKAFRPVQTLGRCRALTLWPTLGPDRVLYGEWLYARHTVYYDRLPHFFLAYDILDTKTGFFLPTEHVRQTLEGRPGIYLPPLFVGELASLDDILTFLGRTFTNRRCGARG